MWQLNRWEALLLQFIFPYILMVKERYNPLDYFRMGIIEEISFFFFDVWNTQSVIKTLGGNNAKILNQRVWNAKQKDWNIHMAFIGKLKALCWFVFRDIFRIQLNIHDGFFWRKQFSLILKLLRQKKLSTRESNMNWLANGWERSFMWIFLISHLSSHNLLY